MSGQFLLPNRVRDTAQAITGTGSYTLSGSPPAGSRSFAVGLGDGNRTTYVAYDQTSGLWEENAGTYTDATKGLSRDIFLDSSTGAPIAWTGQAPQIFIAKPGQMMLPKLPFVSQRWYAACTPFGASSAAPNKLLAAPLYIPTPSKLAALAVVTGGTNAGGISANLGLYADAGGIPGALVAATATLSIPTTGNTTVSGAVSIAVPAGWYWPASILSAAVSMQVGTISSLNYGVIPYPFEMGLDYPWGGGNNTNTRYYQSASFTSFGALPAQFSASAPISEYGSLADLPLISVQAA